MAYGVKYQGSVQSLDGSTYTVKILKDGYSGGMTTLVLGDPAGVVRWGERSADIYEPLRPSAAEVMIFDKADAVRQEIFNADENTYRLRIEKDGQLFWLGKILTDIYEGSLDLRPKSASISAIDGLGQLEGIGFEAETRVSLVQMVADVLAEIGLGLDIRFAVNWFTPDILSSEDPCAKIQIERKALWGENDEPISAKKALEQVLERFGLILFQQGSVWWVVQRELLGASSFRYFQYDATGAFVTSDPNVNTAITIAADVAYGRRHADGRRPYKAAWKTTTAIYIPKADSGPAVTNGSFENWTGNAPDNWAGTPGLPSKISEAADDEFAVSIPAHFNPDPNAYPPYFINQDAAVIAGPLNKLRIRLQANLIKNPNNLDMPQSLVPRKAYFRIEYGNYYLRRAQGGTLSWVQIGQGGQYDNMILFKNTGVEYIGGWQEDELVTPQVPQAVGQVKIWLYQVVEHKYTPGQEQQTADFSAVAYDAVSIEVLQVGEQTSVVTGTKTVSESIVLPNTKNRDERQFTIGDGPSSLTPSRLTVGSTTLTGNWKRGPYSGEQPTGKSIDALLAETWLRAQKTPLEIHDATYISRPGVLVTIEPHNVLVIGTQRFGFVYLERDLKAAQSVGEWVAIKAEDSDLVTTLQAIVEESGKQVVKRETRYGDGTPVGSETYASGPFGGGWSITKQGNRYKLRIGSIEAQELVVEEFLFMQKRVFNGSLIVGRTGTGRPLKMDELGWD